MENLPRFDSNITYNNFTTNPLSTVDTDSSMSVLREMIKFCGCLNITPRALPICQQICPEPPCKVRTGCGAVENFFYRYIFPCLLVLALYGNLMNIMVYRGEYLKTSGSIRLLAAKAIANALFMVVATPRCLLEHFGHLESFQDVYFKTMPYLMYLINVFGSCAAWYTVQMIIDRYLFIAFAAEARYWCKIKHVHISILLTTIANCALQLMKPLTVEMERKKCTFRPGAIAYDETYATSQFSQTVFTVYLYLHWIFVLMVPLTLLLVFTALISYKLLYKLRLRHVQHSSTRNVCVTRLTVITTVCHLLLNSTALPNYLAWAIKDNRTEIVWCILASLTNILGMFEASVPFIIYLSCIAKFRQLYVLLNMKIFCPRRVFNENIDTRLYYNITLPTRNDTSYPALRTPANSFLVPPASVNGSTRASMAVNSGSPRRKSARKITEASSCADLTMATESPAAKGRFLVVTTNTRNRNQNEYELVDLPIGSENHNHGDSERVPNDFDE